MGPAYFVRSNYCHSVLDTGGTPLITAGGSPLEYAELAQGIVFTGGKDISPSIFGQENQGSLGCDTEVDEMELALFEAFYKAGKPILGICRGHQLINVALGGTLIQDIPSHQPNAIAHRSDDKSNIAFHTVKTLRGSRMEALFGPELMANSYHHQAIDTLGRGLIVSAQTEDGIIEAIEHENHRILATQFHPERMTGKEQQCCPNMLPLFRYFVDLCK